MEEIFFYSEKNLQGVENYIKKTAMWINNISVILSNRTWEHVPQFYLHSGCKWLSSEGRVCAPYQSRGFLKIRWADERRLYPSGVRRLHDDPTYCHRRTCRKCPWARKTHRHLYPNLPWSLARRLHRISVSSFRQIALRTLERWFWTVAR